MKIQTLKRLLCLCISIQICLPLQVFAQAHSSGSSAPPGGTTTSRVNLDLSSTDRSVSTRAAAPVDIQLGTSTLTVNPSDLLTPAMEVAVRQVMRSGAQSILLSELGNAVGGSLNIGSRLMQKINNLILPKGVTALVDFGTTTNMELTGNLNNYGQLFALSTNASNTTAAISALNIINQSGATISSVLPAGLSVSSSAVAQLNLALNAIENIVNSGQITSSGSLTMSAGGSITNALPAGVTGPAPVIQAANNVNLISNNILNSGIVTSTQNNINIISQLAQDLNVVNYGGSFQAPSGAINFRDATFSEQANLSVSGGDFVANALNMYSGSGKVFVDVGEINGTLNVYACEAHITAATNNLDLGAIELTGDPSIINTAGNITISSNQIFSGQELSIIASGDVTTTVGGLQIDTSSAATNGGNILIVAGANVSTSGGTATITPSALPTLGSATGGKIDFLTSPLSTLTSRGTAAGNSNGGNITLVAYAGSGAGAGTISLPTGNAITIRTGGNNSGNNGNVTMIAGANPGSTSTLSFGNANTTGGLAGTGNISLSTATPDITGGSVSINIATGAASGGPFTAGTTQGGSIVANNLTAPGSNVAITAGANAGIASISDVGNNGAASTGGSVSVSVNSVTNTGAQFIIGSTCSNCIPSGITVTSATSGVTGNAGTINVKNFGTGGIKVTNPGLVSVPVLTLTGNGGTINLDAAAGAVAGVLDLAGGTYAADATGSATGGNIILRGSTLINTTNATAWTFSARAASAGSGSGGSVSVTTTGAAGSILFGAGAARIGAITVQSGNSGGNGGSVTLSAGQNLAVTAASITSRPQGVNGAGPLLTFKSGTAGAGSLQITGTVNANGQGTGNGGSVSIIYNDPANPFIVGAAVTNSGVTGNITADAPGSGTGGLISISNTAPAGNNISLTGSVSANSATGSKGSLDFTNHELTGGTLSVSVTGSGSLVGFVNAAGTGVTISTGTGDLTTALLHSETTMTLAANGGNLTILGGSAGGALTLSSAATKSVTVGIGSIVSGTSVSVTSGTIINNGTISASTGNLAIQSNAAGGALTVTQAASASLNAGGAGANITFNATTAGAVTVTGGTISANNTIDMNGGTGAASMNVSAVGGTLTANGTSVSATTGTGNLTAGAVSSSSGSVSLTASNGNVSLTDNVSSAGALNVSTGSTGSFSLAAGKTASGTTVTVTSGTANVDGTLSSSTGSTSLQSNAAGGALNVLMGAGGSLTAATSVLLNPTTAGAVTVNGGSVNVANLFSLNGGSGAVSASISSLVGTLTANGSSVNASVGSGNLNAGSITSTAGAVSLSASNGNLSLTDDVNASGGSLILASGATGSVTLDSGKTASGDSVSVSSGTANVNGTLTAGSGNLSMQSNAGDGSLTVSMGAGGSLNASADVLLNNTTAGAVTVSGGSVSAGNSVSMNGGSGAASMNVSSVSGTVSANGSTVSVTAGSGNLTAGAVASSAGFVSLTASNGDLSLTDDVSATGGSLSLASGSTGSVTLAGGKTASGDSVSIASGTANVNGTLAANSGNLSMQSNAGDGSLTVSMGASGLLNASADVLLNNTTTGAVTVSGGSVSAGNSVSMNGGSGAASMNVSALSGTVSANGSSVSVTSGSGNVTAGAVASSAGGVTLAANGGNLSLTDDVTATGGNLNLASGSVGQVTLASGKTASGNSVSVTSGTANINGTLTANSGDLSMQSNGAGNALNVVLGAGASLNANAAGANVNFNSGSAGAISASGGPGNGSISAAVAINLNGGSGAVALDVNSASGTVNANGGTINLSVGGGNLTAGSLTGSGNATLSTGNGNVSLSDNIAVSGGSLSVTTSAGGSVSQSAGKTASADSVSINSGTVNADGTISAGSGDISIQSNAAGGALNVALSSGSGLSASGNILLNQTSAGTVSVTGAGGSLSAGGTINLNGGAGTVTLNTGSVSGTVTSNGTSVAITTGSGGLTLGSNTATNGSLSATAAGGTLTVANGAALSATEGDVNLVNSDALAGSISVGQSASISATTTGTTLGRVNIALGSVPGSPVAGTAPANLNVSLTNGGTVFWGTNSITADAPAGTVSVDGGRVVFSTGSRPASAIHLGSSVSISSQAVNAAPAPTLITSLDLTDPSVVSLILSLQTLGQVGGTLLVSGGIAVGGNAIIMPSSLASSLTAEHIPNNVTITLKDFQSANPVNISLNGSSTTPTVTINGTKQFVATSGTSDGFINITSTLGAPVLSIGGSGLLTSDGGLTVTGNGNMNLKGPVIANTVSIQTTANNGTIAVSEINATTSVTINAHGSGEILRNSAQITSPTVTLISQSGDIGRPGKRIHIQAQFVSANTTGDVYLKLLGPSTIMSSSAGGQFRVRSQGDLTVGGNIAAKDLVLRTISNNGNITLGANLNAIKDVIMSTHGTGSITRTAGTITADSVDLTTKHGHIGSIASAIQVATNDLQVNAGGNGNAVLSALGSVNLKNSDAGGQFKLTSTGGMKVHHINARNGSINLTAGSGNLEVGNGSLLFANEGNITLQNSNTAGGTIEIGRHATIFAFTNSNAALGNVSITIGPAPSSPATGTKPSAVTVVAVAGGHVKFGNNSIHAKGINNVMFALARDIVFNTGSAPSSAIKLNGNVTIIADPPLSLPAAAPILPSQPQIVVETPAATSVSSPSPALNYNAVSGRDLVNAFLSGTSWQTNSQLSSGNRASSNREGAIESQNANSNELTAASLTPIAYLHPSAPSGQTAITTSQNISGHALLKHRASAQVIEENAGTYRLNHGEVLAYASRPVTFKLDNCEVSVAAGSLVVLNKEHSLTTVRNIYERSSQSLQVRLKNGSVVRAGVGEELMLGSGSDTINAALKSDSIGRRRQHTTSLPGGMTLSRCETSLTSLIGNNSLLRSLSSSQDKYERALSAKLIKMAACLMLSTSGHGNYTTSK